MRAVTNREESMMFNMMFMPLYANAKERRPPSTPMYMDPPTEKIPGMIRVPSAANGMLDKNLDAYLFLILLEPVNAGIILGNCVANAIPITEIR